MFFRRAWQRVGPLARWLLMPLSKSTAPVRHMAFGVPGGSSNMAYVVLCGGGLTAAVVYAYKTVNGDTERYEDRLANMSSKQKAEVTSAAKEEPALGAEITAQSVAPEPEGERSAEPTAEVASEQPAAAETLSTSSEPLAETSAEPTSEVASEEPAAAEKPEVDAAEAEPADVEGADPVAEEETPPEAASEDAAVPSTEDAEAETAGMAAVDEAPADAETPSEAPEPEASHAAEMAA